MAFALAGCSTAPASRSFGRVRDLAHERLGAEVRWSQSASPADAESDSVVRRLLAMGLDADRAVKVALLNNPSLQAAFEEIGIARADLLQAGLLQNPSFHIGTQFGTGGSSGTRLDYSLVAAFLDVVRIPLRRRVAQCELESATLAAADATLALARDVRVAFWDVAAATEVLEVRRVALEALHAAADLARGQAEAGNLPELERRSEEDAAVWAGFELVRAEQEVRAKREALTRLLGLCRSGVDWALASPQPGIPQAAESLEDLERLAVAQRLDLAAARERVRAIRAGLPLRHVDPWLGSTLGVSGERDADGANHFGPDLTLDLPLFDTGRAATERDLARLRQAVHHCRALEIRVRSETREASGRLRVAREVAVNIRDEWVPRKRRATALWQERYDSMLEGAFGLLRAKREELDAEEERIAAVRDYWIARADVEHAVGGRLPSRGIEPPVPTASEDSSEQPRPRDAQAPIKGHPHGE